MKKKIIEILSKINHPEINSNLVELGMIGEIKEQEKGLNIEMKVPFQEIPIKPLLEELVKKALEKEGRVEVSFSTMSVQERTKFMQLARENWAV